MLDPRPAGDTEPGLGLPRSPSSLGADTPRRAAGLPGAAGPPRPLTGTEGRGRRVVGGAGQGSDPVLPLPSVRRPGCTLPRAQGSPFPSLSGGLAPSPIPEALVLRASGSRAPATRASCAAAGWSRRGRSARALPGPPCARPAGPGEGAGGQTRPGRGVARAPGSEDGCWGSREGRVGLPPQAAGTQATVGGRAAPARSPPLVHTPGPPARPLPSPAVPCPAPPRPARPAPRPPSRPLARPRALVCRHRVSFSMKTRPDEAEALLPAPAGRHAQVPRPAAPAGPIGIFL